MAHFKLAAVILMGLVLAGCKHSASVTCPPLFIYTVADMKQAAREYARIKDDAVKVALMVDDYGLTRNAISKCLAHRK